MKRRKSFLVAIICLVLGFTATIAMAQQATDDLAALDAESGANLVVTSVSGPAKAILGETIAVTCNVKNLGDAASGAYNVGLYLSANKTIDPATDRLLKNVTIATALAPGNSRRITAKMVVPTNGLSGNYYYGAVVASSSKASSKQGEIVRYTADDNDTVTDHKTGLVWQKADDGGYRDWADANQYCEDLVLGGNADWRLPRMDELLTIVDYSRTRPAIDPLFVCRSYNYWSGSTYADGADGAWGIYFGNGVAYWNYKTYSYYVRCARGGPW